MRGLLRRATTGYGRTVVVGVASSGLLLASLGTASGQEGKPFSNGTAKATAIVAEVAPGVGSLQLGITSGVAVSEIKNTVGQAQAKTLDLGLIGSTLTGEGCSGRPATLKPSDLPQAIRVDSRQGKARIAEDEVPIAGPALGVGRKEVSADPQPSATAVSYLTQSLAGILTLNAGRAEATTQVIKGEAREARARVSFDVNIGGFLDLSALRWEAFHRTGKDPKATADFDLGTAKLLGLPIPMESLHQLEGVVNMILAPSGLSISFPRVERFTEPADLIRVTPLQILLKDTPVGAAVLGPILNISREQREQLFDELAAQICDAAGALLVGDIAISVAAGTGFLSIELGGAEATTGELVLDSPFGEQPPDGPVLTPPPSTGGPITPPTVPAAVTPPTITKPVAEVGPLTDHCESSHPLRNTSCSKGALLLVGIVGLAATTAVGALDWQKQRRRRKVAEVVA